MAKEMHVVNERIQFDTKGHEETLKRIKAIEGALRALEKGKVDASGLSKDELERINKLLATMEKMNRLSRKDEEGRRKKKREEDESARGIFELYEWFKRNPAVQILSGIVSAAVKSLDALTWTNREMSSIIQTSGHLGKAIEEGLTGPLSFNLPRGIQRLNEMSMGLRVASKSLGITEDKGLAILKAYQQGGIAYDRAGSRFKEAAVSIIDTSYDLYGSLDKMGDVVAFQSDLMDRFGYSLNKADRELRSVGLDAHMSGMATERFMGAIKDVAGSLDLYGGSVKTVSGLLAQMSKTTGAAKAIQDAKNFTAALEGMSDQQKNFIIQVAGGVPALKKALEGELKAAREALSKARGEGDAEAIRAAEDRIKRTQLATKGISGSAVSPYALSEAWRVMGTQNQMLLSIDAAIRKMTEGRATAESGYDFASDPNTMATMARVVGTFMNLEGDKAYDMLFRLSRIRERLTEENRDLPPEKRVPTDWASIIRGFREEESEAILKQQSTAEGRAKDLVMTFEGIVDKALRNMDEAFKSLGPTITLVNTNLVNLTKIAEEWLRKKPDDDSVSGRMWSEGARDFALRGDPMGFLKAALSIPMGMGEGLTKSLTTKENRDALRIPFKEISTLGLWERIAAQLEGVTRRLNGAAGNLQDSSKGRSTENR